MSEPDRPEDHAPDVEAAELALGLLDGEERAVALRRVLAEPAFAAEVELWRSRFGELFDRWPDADASARSRSRIEQAILTPRADPARQSSRVWKAWAATATAVAAALLLVVATRTPQPTPTPTLTPAEPVLVAAIASTAQAAPLTATYRPGSAHLTLPATPPAQPGRSAQLWVIGSDSVPHSLGLLRPASRADLTVAPDLRPRMAQGATIAISIEPAGGSPTGLPTGPVIASGHFSQT